LVLRALRRAAHQEYLHVSDIETQLAPVFERFWSQPEQAHLSQLRRGHAAP
jgi:hypothetical protein